MLIYSDIIYILWFLFFSSFFSLNQRNLLDITQIDGIFAKLWLNCITNNWIIVLFIVTTKIFSNQKHSTKKWRKKHKEKVVKSALKYLSTIILRWSASQSTGTNFRTFKCIFRWIMLALVIDFWTHYWWLIDSCRETTFFDKSLNLYLYFSINSAQLYFTERTTSIDLSLNW